MKITHVIWSLTYGGAETLLVQLLNRQCLAHEVEMIVVNNIIEPNLISRIDSRVRKHLIKRPLHNKNPLYFLKLSQLLLSAKSDIFHFHQDNLIDYIPVRKWIKNRCLTVHSVKMDIDSLYKYNHLFAISRSTQEQIKKKCRLDSTLIYNGINIIRFRLKTDYNSGNKKWHFVQIGRLIHEIKGHDLLIKALGQLKKERKFDNFILHFFGEGPSRQYLEQLSDEMNLSEQVIFEGNKSLDFIQERLCEYDLLIQPSRYEGFGLTVIEAMAAKVPVLSSNADGLQEIIGNNLYGYTFTQGNVDNLHDKLLEVIQTPQEDIIKMTQQAYDYVVCNFDISTTTSRYLEAYQNILNTPTV